MSLSSSSSHGDGLAADPLSAEQTRKGALAALFTYVSWGFLPLLFRLLDEAGSVLIVAERTVWSLVLLTGILALFGGFDQVVALLRDRRRAAGTLLSAVLLASNWLLYVWAVESGQVLEASFGYFINPLVNVVLGMLLLGERQNLLQTVSILIAAVGIGIQAFGLGHFPVVALGLALSFGFYGLCRKTAALGPASGLFAETAVMAPFALAFVGYTLFTQGPGVHADPLMLALLILTGPATAVPLLLFGYAVKRLRLTTMGMFQYFTPSLQFLVAIIVFGEHLNGVRLFSFALIWLSLAVFTYDSFRRRSRRPAVAVETGA